MPIWANTPGMRLGADPAVDRGDGAEPALAGPLRAVIGARAAGEETGTRQLLDAHGETHVDLTGLDRHDRGPQRGGTRGACVGDVVDGDAGLADLLLQFLADAAAPIRFPAAKMPMSAIVTPPSASAPKIASAPRSTMSLSKCLPNLVMWIPRIQMSSLLLMVKPRFDQEGNCSSGISVQVCGEAAGLVAVRTGRAGEGSASRSRCGREPEQRSVRVEQRVRSAEPGAERATSTE